MKLKPIIGITMGDPFGNGPELTVKALYEECRPVVVGDLASMKRALAICNSPFQFERLVM